MNLRWIVGCCTLVSFAAIGFAAAEEPTAKAPAENPTATSPELLELLQKWEAATPQGEVVEIEFERYIYDSVFYAEERGMGRFVYLAPDQGLIELKPMPLKSGAKSTRKDFRGRPYDLRPISPMLWYWDGDAINQVDMKAQHFRRTLIPETASLTPEMLETINSWWRSPWPFFSKPQHQVPLVVDIKAEQLLDDYHWTQGQEHAKGLHLIARPRTQMWRDEFKQADVLLDKETLRTKAIAFLDPTGNTQTLIVIKNVKTDPAQIGEWQPRLSEYKLMDND